MRGFKVPRQVFGLGLKHAQLIVYLYLLSRRNAAGRVTVTYGQIAEKVNLSPRTVASAVDKLAAAVIVVKGYKRRDGRIAAMELTVSTPACDRWIWVETRLFELNLTVSELTVYLYLKGRANQSGMAFPSLSVIHRGTGLAKKTIISAIKALTAHSLIRSRHYTKADKSYGNNNYSVIGCAALEIIMKALRKKKARTRKLRRRLKVKLSIVVSEYYSFCKKSKKSPVYFKIFLC